MKTNPPRFQVRPRLYRGGDIAIGPGKADLLEAIRKAGSIGAAAESMGMSYMRAWMLASRSGLEVNLLQ